MSPSSTVQRRVRRTWLDLELVSTADLVLTTQPNGDITLECGSGFELLDRDEIRSLYRALGQLLQEPAA